MNKFFAFVAIAMITLTSCGEKKKKEVKETAPAKVQEMKTGSLKIAFYNQDSLKSQFAFYKEQDEYIQKKQLAYQAEIKRMSDDYRGFVQKNQEKAQKGLLSQIQLEQLGAQAQAKEQKIMQYEQNQGKKIEEETYKLLEEIGKKIDGYSKEFAEKNKIDILLIQAGGGQFGYITPTMDVTTEFIEYLNANEEAIKADISE